MIQSEAYADKNQAIVDAVLQEEAPAPKKRRKRGPNKTKPVAKPADPFIGVGGAPTRTSILPKAGDKRKEFPVASGVLDYFPDALVAVSEVSYKGNQQHNPGQPLHWARGKSTDEADTMIRHFLERGKLDNDGVRHTAKMAWRALAMLQKEIEAENKSNG